MDNGGKGVLQAHEDVNDYHMGTAKWIRKDCTELIGDQVGGYG